MPRVLSNLLCMCQILCQADTIGISETWLRVGELSIIKHTLLQSPALSEVVCAKDLLISAKSSMCDADPGDTGRPYGGLAVVCKARENITYTEITIDSDRVLGVKVCNHSGILEVLLYVYMPFYNGNVAQIELYLEAIDVLQGVIDQFAALCPVHIIVDMNVRLPRQQVLHRNWYTKDGFKNTRIFFISLLTITRCALPILLVGKIRNIHISVILPKRTRG